MSSPDELKDEQKIVYETHSRSIAKSLTFRVFVLLSDSIIVSTITGQLSETLSIVIFTNLSSTILYYLHERIWVEWKWLQLIFGNQELKSAQFTKSLVKAISFRIIVICSDLIISSTITGSVSTALGIIIFTNIGSTVVYYLHEIAWNLISWGKKLRNLKN